MASFLSPVGLLTDLVGLHPQDEVRAVFVTRDWNRAPLDRVVSQNELLRRLQGVAPHPSGAGNAGSVVKYASAALLSLLAGCAAIQGLVAADSEEILAQAGFQRQALDAPGLPARQLVAQAGTYKFADPDFCACMSVGGAREYAELQRLRAERIAERDWALRHNSNGKAYSPIVWGAWRPEGLDLIDAPIASTGSGHSN